MRLPSSIRPWATQNGAREPSVGRGRALSVAGLLGLLDADLEGGERACREGLRMSGSGEEWYRALCLNVLGTAARYRERWEEARDRYSEALALATAEDLWWPAALVQSNLGVLAELEGRRLEAVERHEQAVAIARQGGDAWLAAASLMNSGRAVRQLGDLDRASALQAEALRSFVGLENAWGVAACVDLSATIASDRGQHFRAARLYGAEEAIRERARVARWPTIRAEHEAGMQATASALGEAAWARAHAQGRALTQEEAVAEARTSAALRPVVAAG